jgi:hypothetical protein
VSVCARARADRLDLAGAHELLDRMEKQYVEAVEHAQSQRSSLVIFFKIQRMFWSENRTALARLIADAAAVLARAGMEEKTS